MPKPRRRRNSLNRLNTGAPKKLKKRRRWLAENKDAIEHYNNRIDRAGVFSDGLRRFSIKFRLD